jgi:mRNA interferase HigB
VTWGSEARPDISIVIYSYLRIIGRERLESFKPKYAATRKPLAKWEAAVDGGIWANFSDVRETFNSADYVAPHTVFDTGGNKYRVITVIQYQLGLVLVKHVLTHVEYDRGGWK